MGITEFENQNSLANLGTVHQCQELVYKLAVPSRRHGAKRAFGAC